MYRRAPSAFPRHLAYTNAHKQNRAEYSHKEKATGGPRHPAHNAGSVNGRLSPGRRSAARSVAAQQKRDPLGFARAHVHCRVPRPQALPAVHDAERRARDNPHTRGTRGVSPRGLLSALRVRPPRKPARTHKRAPRHAVALKLYKTARCTRPRHNSRDCNFVLGAVRVRGLHHGCCPVTRIHVNCVCVFKRGVRAGGCVSFSCVSATLRYVGRI